MKNTENAVPHLKEETANPVGDFLEARGHKFVRYTDDYSYVKSTRAGERTMASIQRFIEGKLRLKVNEKK